MHLFYFDEQIYNPRPRTKLNFWSVCKTAPKSLFSAPPTPHLCTQIWVRDWGSRTWYCGFANQVEGKLETHFSFVGSVGGPWKDISAASHTLLLGLDWVCDSGQEIYFKKLTPCCVSSVYHVTVRTTSGSFSVPLPGTNANVWIKVLGTKGSTDQIQLDHPGEDEFTGGRQV